MHLRIGVDAVGCEALVLPLPRRQHPRADFRRASAAEPERSSRLLHCGYLDMDIDAIQQRAGDFSDVALHHGGVQRHSCDLSLK